MHITRLLICHPYPLFGGVRQVAAAPEPRGALAHFNHNALPDSNRNEHAHHKNIRDIRRALHILLSPCRAYFLFVKSMQLITLFDKHTNGER